MEVLQGTGVFGGVVIGPLRVLVRQNLTVPEHLAADRTTELAAFEQARIQAGAELDALYAQALSSVGEAEAAIFEIHHMMLDDLDFVESVTGFIEGEGRNAQWAVASTVDSLVEMFSSMDDETMRARAADVRDVGRRVLRALRGDSAESAGTTHGILAADDLDPGETVGLDPAQTPALVTTRGSTTSHTAILARTKGIPAIIGLGRVFTAEDEGRMVVVDGETGRLTLDPDADTLIAAKARVKQQVERTDLLQSLRGRDNVSRSGRRIDIFANIGRVDEVAVALANDAGGIGLFRSEFLYLERDTLPSEEVLFGTYRAVLQGMAGRKVVFRTLDIGADKQAAYLNLDKEENPALGLRGVRLCLERPDIFRTQLRALFRASAFGGAPTDGSPEATPTARMGLMVPMVVSVAEVRRVRAIIEAVRAELLSEGYAVADRVEFGIMIETPAAAIISDLLATEVDFFSIGTNDLTQYVLAADRQNHSLTPFIDTHHPALLRLIRTVAENARTAGIWVGICGELAADLSLTQTFLDMGIDELSVSPALVLPVRQAVLRCE